jgi:hypothetical protein
VAEIERLTAGKPTALRHRTRDDLIGAMTKSMRPTRQARVLAADDRRRRGDQLRHAGVAAPGVSRAPRRSPDLRLVGLEEAGK